jgi:hypothetical protein
VLPFQMEPQISVQSTDLAFPATLPAPDPQHTTSVAESRSASSRTSAILDFASNAIESAALRDGLKLIVLGGALEAARRGCGLVAQQILERERSCHATYAVDESNPESVSSYPQNLPFTLCSLIPTSLTTGS